MKRASAIVLRAALPALALALGACQIPGRTGDPYRRGPSEASYRERVYYRDSRDAENVRYYDPGRPEVVTIRHVYRENDGRTYYVEREQGVDRRYYYDDDAARRRRQGDDRGHDDDRYDGHDRGHDDGRDGR